MNRDGGKKSIPDHLAQESYRLWADQKWSPQRIADWLLKEHGHEVSREWVRRLLEGMRGAEGEAIPEGEPEDLSEDQQLLKLQCSAYRDAMAKARRGDTNAFATAAKIHIQAVLARKRLREEPGAGAGVADPPSLLMDLPGVGRANGKSSN